ncbi:MAG TPA: NlpC/P60 family protein, partial [Actinomycetota bacterium]|nr:NlpC/P60 family protein [Actinomycetota bacterium]
MAVALVAVLGAAPASARGLRGLPDWVRPAARYLVGENAIDIASFAPNQPMTRKSFTHVMTKVFGGGYSKTSGTVHTAEVDAALVRVLGRASLAAQLRKVSTPDGWQPQTNKWFGTEIVAREMGLRYDHGTSDEGLEASRDDEMSQGNVAYAVWRAATSPSTYGADELESFSLPNLDETQQKVVQYAFSQVGIPYVWGGEWPLTTSSAYPYGTQTHGGFDCSGFSWYVLRKASGTWTPRRRPYAGWNLPERSSSQMAGATRNKLSFKELKPADLVFFASGGRGSSASSVYHVGVFLGHGWMIDSSGSQDGVSLS